METATTIEMVKMIPISPDPKKAECDINRTIYDIQRNHRIMVREDICGAVDPYKFMFAYSEEVGAKGEASASYGVCIVEGSHDYNETEKRINSAFRQLILDKDHPTQFINISYPSEHMYVIFYRYGGGESSYPIVKIRTIGAVPLNAEKLLGDDIERWVSESNIEPYDKIMIDNNHIMFICAPM